MPAPQFHLITHWHLPAPITSVWKLLSTPEDWPSWWRAVKAVELLERGDSEGVGAYRRLHWRTALPYEIAFNMRTTRIVKPSLIEGHADGELTGIGRWQLTPADSFTDVRYDWIVDVGKPWMRVLLPLARPVFRWNHNVVMRWGEDGIRSRLQ